MFKKKSRIYRQWEGRKHVIAWNRLVVFLPVAIIIGGLGYILFAPDKGPNPFVAAESISNAQSLPEHPLASVALPTSAQSSIGTLYEGVVKSSETGIPVPMASIAKVVTALVILEKAPLALGEPGDIITLEQKDEDYYWQYVNKGGTVTGVAAGMTMSQYEMLQTMLLASSNNMSDTIVDHYFESKEEYLKVANAFLEANDITRTTVADTTGFSRDSISTPSDLVSLGQLALLNPVIAEIVNQESAFVSVAGELPNYNPFIREPLVTGLKPGFTDEAGTTLLFSADVPLANGEVKTVIGAVLGHEDVFTFFSETKSVINQAAEIYSKL